MLSPWAPEISAGLFLKSTRHTFRDCKKQYLLARWSVIMQLLRQMRCRPSNSPSTMTRCSSSSFDLHDRPPAFDCHLYSVCMAGKSAGRPVAWRRRHVTLHLVVKEPYREGKLYTPPFWVPGINAVAWDLLKARTCRYTGLCQAALGGTAAASPLAWAGSSCPPRLHPKMQCQARLCEAQVISLPGTSRQLLLFVHDAVSSDCNACPAGLLITLSQ